MADSHTVLAPLIEPPLPPLPSASAAGSVAASAGMVLPLALVLLVLALAAARWGWRRRAPQRALRRIVREPDVLNAAEQLAQWQHRRHMHASAEWLQALDRLRFGPFDAGAHDTLQRLCGEAADFPRRAP